MSIASFYAVTDCIADEIVFGDMDYYNAVVFFEGNFPEDLCDAALTRIENRMRAIEAQIQKDDFAHQCALYNDF